MASLEELERNFKNHIHGGADTRRLEYDSLLDKPSTAGDSEKVKADAGDPTAQYLDGKVQYSITVDGTNHKLQLSGDANAPGNSKYYGTNGAGTRGYYTLPVDTDIYVKSDAADPTAGYLDAKVEYSVVVDATNHKIKLDGDANAPGNGKYYGTDAGGTRGYYTLPSATGAPTDAKYWVSEANGSLSAEVNLGALTTGLLKHSVAAGVSTPATASAGTDYYNPGGTDVAVADGGTGKSSWTQYLIPYADTTTSFSQVAIGTAGQVLTSNGAGSAPTFQTGTLSHIDGDASDGDVVISTNTTITRDMYYNDLTVNASRTLTTAGFKVFVKGTLTNNGTIKWSGNDGASGYAGDTGGFGSTVPGGDGGAGGAALTDGTLGGSVAGKAGAAGGTSGLAPSVSGDPGGNGANGNDQTSCVMSDKGRDGVTGGTGGTGLGTGLTGGASGSPGDGGTSTVANSKPRNLSNATLGVTVTAGVTSFYKSSAGAGGSAGGGGGCSGGFNYPSGGGGGGAGGAGSPAGNVLIVADTIINNGDINCNGGWGGNGGTGGHGTPGLTGDACSNGGGGGGGGSAGNGGILVLIYHTLTNTGTIEAVGGTGGTGGSGGVATQSGSTYTKEDGADGDDGLDGYDGIVVQIQI